MRTCLAVLFPYFIIQFVFEHPWPFMIFGGIFLLVVMVQKKCWHDD
jgi:energy-coupling factor transporter transmembrane protein EcfT